MKPFSMLFAFALIAAALSGCVVTDGVLDVVFGPDPATGTVTGCVTGTGVHPGSIFHKTVSIDTDPDHVYVGSTMDSRTLDAVRTGETVTIAWKATTDGQRWITAITRKE